MNFDIEATPIAGAVPPEPAAALDRGVRIDAHLRDACTAHGRGRENLDRLFSDAGALCVTTGQQPGLFTGPLFTVYKALSAVALAEAYAEALDRPVVPVFWVAGDDHDFAEANHIELLATDNELARIALPDRPPDAPTTPLYRQPLGADVDAAFEALAGRTPETEFRPEVLEWLRRHYHAENDLATAFRGALAELLGDTGLVMFDPTHRAAKRAAAGITVRALEEALTLGTSLASVASNIERSGRSVQVPVDPTNTLVMVDGPAGRDRLVADDGQFTARRSGTSFTLDELRALADREPERLSANVLLRPVVEAALLPTLAYVAGPGELAYIEQAGPVYETMGVRPQPYVPRWSGRIVEARVRRTLNRYDISIDDLTRPEGQLEGRLVQKDMPDEVEQALAALRRSVDDHFPPLVAGAEAIDATLRKAIEGTRHQVLTGLAHAEKRILAKLKQNHETLVRQLANARHAIWPHARPQERVFNIVPYLIRYSTSFVDDMLNACREWARTAVGAAPTPE